VTRALGIGIYPGRVTSAGAAPPPSTPATILGANLLVWLRSDLGVTESGGVVSTWADQSGNGHNFTQGTAANRPAYNATGGPNSTPSILFDGANDGLINSTLNLPAPATTPTFFWLIFRQVTWTNTDRVFSAATGMFLGQNSASPGLRPVNAANGTLNNSLPINTYTRGEVFFNEDTTDYSKFGGAAAATGADCGNTDPAIGLGIGSATGGGLPSNIEVCEFVVANVLPSAGQLSALDAYVTSRYGAGLV
jgi:hypothetical protein